MARKIPCSVLKAMIDARHITYLQAHRLIKSGRVSRCGKPITKPRRGHGYSMNSKKRR